jgi:hypothetical protein
MNSCEDHVKCVECACVFVQKVLFWIFSLCKKIVLYVKNSLFIYNSDIYLLKLVPVFFDSGTNSSLHMVGGWSGT